MSHVKPLLREHFREDGKPKRRFADEAKALAHAKRYGYPPVAYRCSVCDGWHLAKKRR